MSKVVETEHLALRIGRALRQRQRPSIVIPGTLKLFQAFVSFADAVERVSSLALVRDDVQQRERLLKRLQRAQTVALRVVDQPHYSQRDRLEPPQFQRA